MAGITTTHPAIMPAGDSLPTVIPAPAPSVVVPVNVEVNGNLTTGTGVRTPDASVASAEVHSSPVASQGPVVVNGQLAPLQAGAIIAIVLAVIMFIGLVMFAVRRYFVRQRASKVTPARARASQFAISGPTNFQHVSTADRSAQAWGSNEKQEADVGEPKGDRAVNFGALESGLQDPMQKTRNAKAASLNNS